MGIVHRMPESNKEININNSCRETCLKRTPQDQLFRIDRCADKAG